MSFCAGCGFKLPDGAVFCPNCGSSVAGIKADIHGAAATREKENSDICISESRIMEPSDGNETTQNRYMLRHGQEHITEVYAYPPQGVAAKRFNGKVVAIIIAASVILVAIAGYIICKALNSDPYVGYWESSAIQDENGDLTDDYYGESVVGLLGIQINSDGSAYLGGTGYNDEVYAGQWTETATGIRITVESGIYDFTASNGMLLMQSDEVVVIFEKSREDINDRTIPHGSIAEDSNSI